MNQAKLQVAIIDSVRGSYLLSPDIEREILEPYADVTLHRVKMPEELFGCIEETDGIISWHHIPIQRELIARLQHCRGIVRAGVGVDNVELAYAAERGIPVCNVPDYGTEEVADHTMALLLALVRKLRQLDLHARGGGWDWRTIGSVPRLRGTALGIIGFGRIGSAVARRAQAFGMSVGFYDPYVASGTEKAHGVTRYESLPELLDQSHIISIHVPLTTETFRLIGRAELQRMNEETILINTARGEIMDQEALIESLGAGKIGQVGLDVLSDEPRVPAELRSSDKVLLTAHAAFYADIALTELRHKAAASVLRLLQGRSERNVVNGVRRAAYAQASQGGLASSNS
jgi:D-3-phosphoglycerate dehydrogenase/C-terminal binding protein